MKLQRYCYTYWSSTFGLHCEILYHIFSASNAQSTDVFTLSIIVLVGVEWALNLLCDITRNLQFTLSSLFSTLFYRTVKQ